MSAIAQETPVVRTFAHYTLVRMLGRGALSLAWLASDNRSGREVRLLVSRHPVATQIERERCVDDARRAARLQHPRLSVVTEIGCFESFPYLTCDASAGQAFGAAQTAPGQPIKEIVRLAAQLMEGLAYAHEAGVAHGDPGLHTLWVDAQGHAQFWGLGLVTALAGTRAAAATGRQVGPGDLLAREVTAVGLMLHQWLAGQWPHGETNLTQLIDRLAEEPVSLPHEPLRQVPDSLRLMVDRATDLRAQRRFIHARSFERALSNWQLSQEHDEGGFATVFAERLRRAGPLPARPMLIQRVVRVVGMDRQRLDQVVDCLLEDPALSLAILRIANTPEFLSVDEPRVISVQRAVQLMGTLGLRRVASSLKPWPGMLRESQVKALEKTMNRSLLAGHLAEFLTPAGINPETTLLAAQFQLLGRLLALYHFPDEMAQIARLMAAAEIEVPEDGPPPEPISEEVMISSMIGVTLDDLATTALNVAGLSEVLHELITPCPPAKSVPSPHTPAGWVRVVASCANEVLAVNDQPPGAQQRVLTQVINRYHRSLGLDEKQVRLALGRARDKLARHLR